ncbi:unnamed protein product [Cuscuta epithymum]|uniref:Uncharacterized protein n=1 Tax=Cuscuta epithymum TaxID=186058 RepID=A0AAV0G6A0_9ASTE|nr:unnamed protein product [Cuscuta epithymum]
MVNGGCNMFEWIDAEMCPRSKVIIPGLLRKINKLQLLLEEKNAMPQKKKIWTVLCCLVGGLMMLALCVFYFDVEKKNKLDWEYCEVSIRKSLTVTLGIS